MELVSLASKLSITLEGRNPENYFLLNSIGKDILSVTVVMNVTKIYTSYVLQEAQKNNQLSFISAIHISYFDGRLVFIFYIMCMFFVCTIFGRLLELLTKELSCLEHRYDIFIVELSRKLISPCSMQSPLRPRMPRYCVETLVCYYLFQGSTSLSGFLYRQNCYIKCSWYYFGSCDSNYLLNIGLTICNG